MAQSSRVESLLATMTLEEKAGQMTQMTLGSLSATRGWVDGEQSIDAAKLRAAIVGSGIGSVLNNFDKAMPPDRWRQIVTEVQRVALEETRLGIPVIYGVDSVHGANYVTGATIFPQNLALAATWDPEMARVAGEITAAEMLACGLPWNFAPVADVARQPYWSRFFETFGEDPLLASAMTGASVAGLQGRGLSSFAGVAAGEPIGVAACLKHFFGYSAPRSGRDRTPAFLSVPEMHDVFLPPFRAGFAEGARTVMVNSGVLNGEAVHASRGVLTGLLRERLGFRGVVLTDWEDVIKLHTVHRVAQSPKEAVAMAVEAGVDMSMVPSDASFAGHLVELVREGRVSPDRVDQSVRRILTLKEDLGLFESPVPGEAAFLSGAVGSTANRAAARGAALASLVLLKNEAGLLPLDGSARVLVTGPGADSVIPLHGSWTYSWQGTEAAFYPDTPTIARAMIQEFGADRVRHIAGNGYDASPALEAAVDQARRSDVILLCLAEAPSTEKPGDIDDLALPRAQLELADALIATGKPVVIAMAANRPRLLTLQAEKAAAFIWLGQPGPHGPEALAAILRGRSSPSGRLPFTYPRVPGLILTYDHTRSDDLGPEYQPGAFSPLFHFGSGLTYTSFDYARPQVRPTPGGDGLEVSVVVRNTGGRAGVEVVQAYLSDEYASLVPRVKRLAAFQRVEINAGEEALVRLVIPAESFGFTNTAGQPVFEPGAFTLRIGGHELPLSVSKSNHGGLILE